MNTHTRAHTQEHILLQWVAEPQDKSSGFSSSGKKKNNIKQFSCHRVSSSSSSIPNKVIVIRNPTALVNEYERVCLFKWQSEKMREGERDGVRRKFSELNANEPEPKNTTQKILSHSVSIVCERVRMSVCVCVCVAVTDSAHWGTLCRTLLFVCTICVCESVSVCVSQLDEWMHESLWDRYTEPI